MQDSDIPAKFNHPWAYSAGGAYIRPIPEASQIGIQNGAASITDGFPPNCFVPIAGGGSWPWGQDANGILNQITAWDRWHAAGGPIVYDATFQTAIGGYPNGAVVRAAAGSNAFWQSTTDNNVAALGGAGWSPIIFDTSSGSSPPAAAIITGASANGANLRMVGNGATTPSKTIRVVGGTLQIMNDGYTVAIVALDNSGNVAISGAFSSAAQIDSVAGNITANSGRLRASLGYNAADLAAAPIGSDFASAQNVIGWQKLPNGLIIQWGENGTGNGIGINFPITFPNNCLGVVVSESQAGAPTWGSGNPTIHAMGGRFTTGFIHWTLTWNGTAFVAAGNTCCWIAIGN